MALGPWVRRSFFGTWHRRLLPTPDPHYCVLTGRLVMKKIFAFMTAFAVITSALHAETFKPNILDPTYHHDRWGTSGSGIVKDFRAYRSSFDGLDDDDNFGGPDALGV